MQGNKYKLSIAIVSWNTVDLLRECLGSVYSHIREVNFQIVVVDNASADGSVDMISEQYPEVVLIKNSDNVGFGAAVNQAVNIVEGEYVLLLNSDARLVADDFSRLIKILDVDRSIGIITGEMVNSIGESMPSYFAFPSFWGLVKANTLNLVYKVGAGVRGKVRKCAQNVDGLEVCDVDWVSGGYLLIRRELIKEDPIFDERLFMFFEDTLLCHKIWSMGFRVVFAPVGKVLHVHGGSTRKCLNKSILTSFMSSRVYIGEVYGQHVLRKYDHIVVGVWRLSMPVFVLLSYFGLQHRAKKKANLFEFLIKQSEAG